MQKVHTHSAMEPQFMHCSNLYNITLRDDSKFIMPSEQNPDHITDVREEPDAHCTTFPLSQIYKEAKAHGYSMSLIQDGRRLRNY
jgi:hypothetical protein